MKSGASERLDLHNRTLSKLVFSLDFICFPHDEAPWWMKITKTSPLTFKLVNNLIYKFLLYSNERNGCPYCPLIKVSTKAKTAPTSISTGAFSSLLVMLHLHQTTKIIDDAFAVHSSVMRRSVSWCRVGC